MAGKGAYIAAMTPGLALSIAASVATIAWLARALSGGGALAATAVGAAVLWSGGWAGGVVLAAFFLPSTVVGRTLTVRSSGSDARGERRDAVQVFANGAVAALGSCVELARPGLGAWVMTGALAAASADTWATSVGAQSPDPPRDLLRGNRVPPGTSGGVSGRGTLGGLAGAILVAAPAAAVWHDWVLLPAGVTIGWGGMLLDSLLGAALQARYRCPQCGAPSERRRHRCGTRTELVGGWDWLDNDGVNAVTTFGAGLLAAGAWWLAR